MALRLRMPDADRDTGGLALLPDILTGAHEDLTASTCSGSALCLVFFTRSYGLYGPIQNRSGLHEQRMTVQATLTAGLLLCGTLYLTRGIAISRDRRDAAGVDHGLLLCLRRAIWRQMVYSRYREGLETRNVLIVGAGRVAHALRNHLESLRHLGFRFKGFVALTEREAESGDADMIGDVRNCLPLARSLFVDEIFFSVPAEKKLVIGLVEEARAVGIDVRVVPDLYDGLAWNAPVEYIGQFPTIPLHRRDFPIGAFLMKRVLDIDAVVAWRCWLLSPIMLVIAHRGRASDSKGPIFYQAPRIGRKGRTFNCYKFRTMVVERRQAEGRPGAHERARRHPVQDHQRPAHHPSRPHPAEVLARRTAAVLQRAARRYEPGRPAAADRLRGGAVRPRAPAPPGCAARDHRLCGRSRRGRTRPSTATSRWTRPTSRTGASGWT